MAETPATVRAIGQRYGRLEALVLGGPEHAVDQFGRDHHEAGDQDDGHADDESLGALRAK